MKSDNFEVKTLKANMGSCQCGDVNTTVLINHSEKKVITQPEAYSWMSGRLKGNQFSVSYAGGFDLPSEGYTHEVRCFSKTEKEIVLHKRA